MTDTILIAVDQDRIATLTIDVPGQSMNVIDAAFRDDLLRAAERVATDPMIKGAVVASGKRSGFMAGADLGELGALMSARPKPSAKEAFARTRGFGDALRRLETCGKPVAAAIEGVALGGGLELALACHYRIAADARPVKLGLPEVQVGLLPGGGGTQRLARMLGAQAALELMIGGKPLSAAEAKSRGVVDALVAPGESLDAARAWVRAQGGTAAQPWDRPGFKVPGGGSALHPGFVQTFVGANALAQGRTLHNYDAPQAILSAVYEGLQLPFDRALAIEGKYFAKLVSGGQAADMVRTLFVNKQAAEKGARRPEGVEPAPTRKLAMLGAGLMGAGIAMVAARSGLEVVLLDRTLDAAEKGKRYTAERLAKRRAPDAQDVLDRIRPTADFADLAGADLVIEAVFEDPAVKADATRRAEVVVGCDAVFGSNTSTLPITGLAEAWSRPDGFIGIHFFSPVEKMALVEIIVGRRTGARAIAKALDFVRAIGKTPILVNDSRGFYTSRCFGTYVSEGYALIGEGVAPALIENAGLLAGMPVGPLAVADEVAIDLGVKIVEQARKELGDAYRAQPGEEVAAAMVSLGRPGRKAGRGFYEYPAEGRKHLWPGLAEAFPLAASQPSVAEVKERLLWRQVAECVRCYGEGVLETPEDGDLGAVFGWGFAPFTGGPFSHVDRVGAEASAAMLERLAGSHGDRFAPPPVLRDKAARGARFYSAPNEG